MKIKCIDNYGNSYLTIGRAYKAWIDEDGYLWSNHDSKNGLNLFHGNLEVTAHGVFEMEEEKSHPHADLMLKCAMIAQYDDKPWESFEVFLDGEWVDCEHEGLYAGIEYRLKPQEPRIKVGQIWVDKNGIEVKVINLSTDFVFTDIEIGGLTLCWSFSKNQLLNDFKLQESK